MQHFVDNDGVNMFRLPTSWQFLINNDEEVSGTLNATRASQYELFVRACLDTGAYCMIDVHNFARFNGGIIGQGGPSDALFVSLWTALAKTYADDARVVFEIVNEPHDLDLDLWVQTCQRVVTAIRGAGATTQMILLPGTNFDSAATLVSSGSADALLNITNPDGSTDGLYLDIHKYLDNNNSGQNEECTTNNVGNFSILADYLREKGRQGLISETGASSSSSCLVDFCEQNTYINANDDVFLGYVGWAAGQFDTSYVLSLTPTQQANGSWTDNEVFSQCMLAPYRKAGGPVTYSGAIELETAAQTSTQSATQTTKLLATSSAAITDNKGNVKGSANASSSSSSSSSTTAAAATATASSTSGASPKARQAASNVLVAVLAGAALL